MEVPWSTITGVAFREVTNALEEFGQDVDDGISSPITNEPPSIRRRSLATQSTWSSDTENDSDGDSIALDEYVRLPSFVGLRLVAKWLRKTSSRREKW